MHCRVTCGDGTELIGSTCVAVARESGVPTDAALELDASPDAKPERDSDREPDIVTVTMRWQWYTSNRICDNGGMSCGGGACGVRTCICAKCASGGCQSGDVTEEHCCVSSVRMDRSHLADVMHDYHSCTLQALDATLYALTCLPNASPIVVWTASGERFGIGYAATDIDTCSWSPAYALPSP